MKKYLSSLAISALLTAPAFAADLPARVPVKAPAVVDVCIWCGFYIGGNVGGAWTRSDVTTTNVGGAPAIFGVPANIAAVNAAGTGALDNKASFTGGGQIGFNWQAGPNWLFGFEADGNWLSRTATLSNVAATTIGPFPVTTDLQTRWLATARARLGITSSNWLAYVTGGAAFTNQKLTQSVNAPALGGGTGGAFGTASSETTKVGWTVGGGLEYMIWSRWSIKGEYLFARFQGVSNSTFVTTPLGGFSQTLTATTDHLNVHIARIGLNYHFGGGPVVARY